MGDCSSSRDEISALCKAGNAQPFSGMQHAEALMPSGMVNSSRFTSGHLTFAEIKLGLEVSDYRIAARKQLEHQGIRHVQTSLRQSKDHPIFSIPPM
jgi:hypothetical protein